MSITQHDILEALEGVRENDSSDDPNDNIVSAGMIEGIQVNDDGDVVFSIKVDPAKGALLEPMRQRAEQVVLDIKSVRSVTAVLTAERPLAERSSVNQAQSNDPHGMAKNPPLELPIKKIIAVASGKGGVGKSTIAAALAQIVAKNSQLNIGLLDADIYGPSQPKLMGLEGHKPQFNDDKKIVPPEAYGVKTMSIGFMVDAEKALVWRGPMVQSALYQLFRDVEWSVQNEKGEKSDLDVLIVDMPPGTGDAQLTLAQKIPVDGAIIVSTPQDLALADARKGIEMFQTVGVPILGLIENMSTHVCSNCGHEEHIFGHGGARAEAQKLGVPFLGEVPLSLDTRRCADEGQMLSLPEEINDKILSLLD